MRAIGSLLALIAALLVLQVPAGAQTVRAVTVLDFLQGVRAAGMAGAFAGLADDEQALFYNPAGLALLEGLHGHAVLGRRWGAATTGSLLGAMPALGAGLVFYGVGGLTQRDASDQEGEAFGYGQFALLGAGALRLGSFLDQPALAELALGLRLRFLRVNTLAPGSGSSFALDPSLLWAPGRLGPLEGARVGLSLDNLGPGLRYGSGRRESLTLGVRLGTSFRLRGVVASLELASADGLHVGAEYALPPLPTGRLTLRAGLATRHGLTVTVGLGFTFQERLRLDYAFVSGPFAGTHRLAFSLALGGTR